MPGRSCRSYLARLNLTIVAVTGDLLDMAALGESVGTYVDQGQPLPSGGHNPIP